MNWAKKFKTITDVFLSHSPEFLQAFFARFFTSLKKNISPIYSQRLWFERLIRFCDFVIVRCNGNRFIEYELSNICNAQCIFCPYPDLLKTDKKFMHMSDIQMQKNVQKFEHFKPGLISFTPTTGDTLLHPEWDRYIQMALESKRIHRATMFTNAINLEADQQQRFLNLLRSKNGYKLNQIYFSVGGLDADTYRSLYKVNRFDKVVSQIASLLELLQSTRQTIGIHIHVKLLKSQVLDDALAKQLFNPHHYPFVYFSQSNLYFSNEQFKKNAIIAYKPDDVKEKKMACAYLQKTRFAADGKIWADGCVISEMPNDQSLLLGDADDGWDKIEAKRQLIIENWEQKQEIPLPCRVCTMYRAR